jgi:hypothetical protein
MLIIINNNCKTQVVRFHQHAFSYEHEIVYKTKCETFKRSSWVSWSQAHGRILKIYVLSIAISLFNLNYNYKTQVVMLQQMPLVMGMKLFTKQSAEL